MSNSTMETPSPKPKPKPKPKLKKGWTHPEFLHSAYLGHLKKRLGYSDAQLAKTFMSSSAEAPALYKLYHMNHGTGVAPRLPTNEDDVCNFIETCFPFDDSLSYGITHFTDPTAPRSPNRSMLHADSTASILAQHTISLFNWSSFYKRLVVLKDLQYEYVNADYFITMKAVFFETLQMALSLMKIGARDGRRIIFALLAPLPPYLCRLIIDKLFKAFPFLRMTRRHGVDGNDDDEPYTHRALISDIKPIENLIWKVFLETLDGESTKVMVASRRENTQRTLVHTLIVRNYIKGPHVNVASFDEALLRFVNNVNIRPAYCEQTETFLKKSLEGVKNDGVPYAFVVGLLRGYLPLTFLSWIGKETTLHIAGTEPLSVQKANAEKYLTLAIRYLNLYISKLSVDRCWHSVVERLLASPSQKEVEIGRWLQVLRLHFSKITETFTGGFDWVWADASVYHLYNVTNVYTELERALSFSDLVDDREEVMLHLAFLPEDYYNDVLFESSNGRKLAAWLNEYNPRNVPDNRQTPMELFGTTVMLKTRIYIDAHDAPFPTDFSDAWNTVKLEAYYEEQGGGGFDAYFKTSIAPQASLREQTLLQRYNDARNAFFERRHVSDLHGGKRTSEKDKGKEKYKDRSDSESELESESESEQGEYIINFVNEKTGQLTRRMRSLDINIDEQAKPSNSKRSSPFFSKPIPPLPVPDRNERCFFCLNRHLMKNCEIVRKLRSINVILASSNDTVTISRAPGTADERPTITLRKLATSQNSCIFQSNYFQGHMIRSILSLKKENTRELNVMDEVLRMNNFQFQFRLL